MVWKNIPYKHSAKGTSLELSKSEKNLRQNTPIYKASHSIILKYKFTMKMQYY